MSTSAASIPTVSSGSYAQIKNPRVARVVRIVGLGVFAVGSFLALISVPADYQYWQTIIAKLSPLSLKIYTDLGLSVQAVSFYGVVWDYTLAVVLIGVGLLIFLRRPDDWSAIMSAAFLFTFGYTGVVPNNSAFTMIPVLAVSYLIFPYICTFPDGRFFPKWSRWLVLPYIIIYTLEFAVAFGVLSSVLYLILILFWCLAVAFQAYRIRRTTNPVQRQQLKLFFSGAFIAILGAASNTILGLYFAESAGSGQAFYTLISPWLFDGGMLIFATLLTFSILRYRLWDIDLVINRGLVYGGLAIGLGILFVVALLVLQGILQTVLGSQQTTLAATISGGAVALLFNPTRLRLQHVVDRRVFGLRVDLNQIGQREADKKPASIKNESLIGKKIGAYEVNDVIGRGGMGEVYLGTQSSLNRQVALKILPPHLSSDLEFRIRFEREARIVASLHHPNIINVFDFGEIEGLYYMAMEYIQGQDLGALLRERKGIALDEAMPVITQIAEALDYAHSQGVVHRDIKPSNVMLRSQSSPSARSHPILMDFGLTKLLGSETGLTQSNILGTLSYTAPEQITASGNVDHRADIYSFGVMCFELLTGKLPFRESNQAALLFAHLQRPAPDPRQFNPALPESAANALLRALEKLPAMRPSSAGEFAIQLSAPVLQVI